MKRYLFLIILTVQQLLLFTNVNSQTLKDGFIDVTNINWDKRVIKLEGTCDFYWKEFLLPSSSEDSLPGHNKLVSKIPKSWTKIKLSEDTHIPTKGYGTYRIRIKVDNKDEIYGIKVKAVFTAYKLYVNGKLLNTVGVVSDTEKDAKPKFKTSEIPIPVFKKGDSSYQILDVVIQTSNYHHHRAGLQRAISFGTMESIIYSTKTALLIHLLLIGIVFIIGFNHVLMYTLRRIEIGNLLFGALATIMILRDISTGERILLHIFPNINWETLVRLDNFSGFGTMTFFALYFYFTYRRDFPKFMFYFIVILGILITVLVFSTTQWVYGQYRIVMEAYVGLGGLYYTFGVLLTATIRKRESAIYTFIGMFLLYTTAINDVLNSMGILNTVYIAPYGIAVFMFLQSFILSKKSAKALSNNEKLSKELREEKLNLEENIEERTQKLTKQAEELKIYQEEQEQQNIINEGLNIITDVMRQNKDNLATLADQLLATLIKRIDASMGALYLHFNVNHEDKLKLLADYGLNSEAKIESLNTNEGLTGKCFNTGKENYIKDITDSYFSISSGLGSATPKILAIIPMKIDELVIGVVEIASFKEITNTHKSFLNKAIENIASQLNIVKINEESKALIQESKELEEEAIAKANEMSKNIIELNEALEKAKKNEETFKSLLEQCKD
jgi:hypothetical protein